MRATDEVAPGAVKTEMINSLLPPYGSCREVFVEITKSEHQHGGPGWQFGTCLWSPTRNRTGQDRYALMRDPQPNDLVLHFYETQWPGAETESRLCGRSFVAASAAVIEQEPPAAGPWSGLNSYYRIELRDYQEFDTGLPLASLIESYEDEIRAEILEAGPRYFPFNAYRSTIRTVQGIYLARCTERLYDTFLRALGIERGRLEAPTELPRLQEEYAEGRRLARERYFFARSPGLVKAAKERYGYRCQICDFEFSRHYGQLGAEYIEVHHLNPLSDRPEAE